MKIGPECQEGDYRLVFEGHFECSRLWSQSSLHERALPML